MNNPEQSTTLEIKLNHPYSRYRYEVWSDDGARLFGDDEWQNFIDFMKNVANNPRIVINK